MKKKYVWFEDLDGVICCPQCRKQVDVYGIVSTEPDVDYERYEPHFCPECGQALDWSRPIRYGTTEEHEA